MRRIFPLLTISALFIVVLGCQSADENPVTQSTSVATSVGNSVVEAGCADCIFKMEGAEGCELAVKIDGKPYLVSGVEVDTHSSGMCESALKAVVSGKVQGDKFVASKFELQ
jgi:hypothetical protein